MPDNAVSLGTFFFREGYRRGAEYTFIYAPTYDNGYSRDIVEAGIAEYERLDRDAFVFALTAETIEQYNAWDHYNIGVREGIHATIKANFMARFNYIAAIGDK